MNCTYCLNLGDNIERITGATGGLLVVLKHKDDYAGDHLDAMLQMLDSEDMLVEICLEEFKITLLESATLRSLQQMGLLVTDEQITQNQTYYQDGDQDGESNEQQDEVNPALELNRQGLEKLTAAEVLIKSGSVEIAVELTISATLMLVSAVTEKEVPELADAFTWLYSDIVPNQLLTQEQISIVSQVLALSASNSAAIPAQLLQTLITNLIDELGGV